MASAGKGTAMFRRTWLSVFAAMSLVCCGGCEAIAQSIIDGLFSHSRAEDREEASDRREMERLQESVGARQKWSQRRVDEEARNQFRAEHGRDPRLD
jgi:hypothetical protein